MLIDESHAAVEVVPWPNSREFADPIVIDAANVDPIVGIKITAARPRAILRLRVLLFSFSLAHHLNLGLMYSFLISHFSFLDLCYYPKTAIPTVGVEIENYHDVSSATR